MVATTVVKSLALARLDIYSIEVALYRVGFVRGNDYRLVLGVESIYILHHEVALGELTPFLIPYII